MSPYELKHIEPRLLTQQLVNHTIELLDLMDAEGAEFSKIIELRKKILRTQKAIHKKKHSGKKNG